MMVFRGPESFELYEGSQQPESYATTGWRTS